MMRSSLFGLLCCLLVGATQAAVPSVDARLINSCASRTDARMDTMTLGKLEQLRNYEFSLRIAMAQQAAGSAAMSPGDWQRVGANLREAREQLAQACGVAVPLQG